MTRLYAVVEGQTEEAFVKRALYTHLSAFEVFAIPIIVATSRDATSGAKRRGGGRWHQWSADMRRLLGEQRDPTVRFTTMFDLYGLPTDFPRCKQLLMIADTTQRASEAEMEISRALGNDRRLRPYVQRHEFEALVLAALPDLESLLDDPNQLAGLRALRQEIGTSSPEDINAGDATAPSKRLLASIPGYRKDLHGPLAVESCGIARLRSMCPRFHSWLASLEGLGRASS